MKILIILLALFSFNSFSKENTNQVTDSVQLYSPVPICALYYAFDLEDEIRALGKNDKFMHCALSCQLTLRCGEYEALNIGILKELWDLIGPGNAEVEDLQADIKGISLATKREAVNDYECINKCNEIYKGVSK